jgi:hypothetical protein
VTERFLDDEARPAAGAAAAAELHDDRLDRIRRHGQVVQAISARSPRRVQIVERFDNALVVLRVGEVRAHVAHALGELVPDVLAEFVPPMLDDRIAHAVAKVLRRHTRTRHADDAELRGKEVSEGERVEGWEELPLREVARCAEDREGAGLGSAPSAQPFEQRVFS